MGKGRGEGWRWKKSIQETVLSMAAALNARKIARSKQFKNQTRQQSTYVDPYKMTFK